jgi:hypothetical protein
MPNKKISQLTAVTSANVALSDKLPLGRSSSANYSMTMEQLATFVQGFQGYAQPQFLFFNITPSSTRLTVGDSLAGTAFTWAILNSENLLPDSIVITDVTNSVDLFTGLSNSGSQAATINATLSVAGTRVWRITAQNSLNEPFSMDFVVSWVGALGSDYWIDTGGSDAADGSEGTPFLTSQHAANLAGIGSNVTMNAGSFAGFSFGYIEDAPSGTINNPIVFNGVTGAIINHKNPQTGDGFDAESVSYTTFSGFKITNDTTVTRAGGRVSGKGVGNIITGIEVDGTGRFGILTGFQSYLTVTNCNVHDIKAGGGLDGTTGHAYYIANSGNFIIFSDNQAANCEGNGLHTNGDVEAGPPGVQTNVLIRRSKFDNCDTLNGGGAAINLDSITDSRIENILVTRENGAGIALYSQDGASVSERIVVANVCVLLSVASQRHCVRLANGANDITIFNSVFGHGNASGLMICADADSLESLASDYNVFMADRFSVNGGATTITLAEWRIATGQDTHSRVITSATTLFNSPSTGDYTPNESGPLINTGVATFNGHDAPVDDLLRQNRPFAVSYDVGPYESQEVSLLITATSPLSDVIGIDPPPATVTFTFDRDIDPDSVTFAVNDGSSDVSGSITNYDSGTFTVTWTPDSTLATAKTFTATISAAISVADSITLVNPFSWSFSTAGLRRLFGNSYTPPTSDGADANDITVAVQFFSETDGHVTKVWFYKDILNIGTHTVKIWDTSGTQLASKVVTGESASGWQSGTFDTPLAITANTGYYASAHCPSGHYSFDNTIHSRSNAPLFSGDQAPVNRHCSGYVSGDAFPTNASDNLYGMDVEVLT